ncbi:hypothetical protein C4569_00245 [Candidatus Parcubacteria bacterium]|nr:MAG: hypothetical protein C4569_00245 [Candidatus Parcubacteria bacterium]
MRRWTVPAIVDYFYLPETNDSNQQFKRDNHLNEQINLTSILQKSKLILHVLLVHILDVN